MAKIEPYKGIAGIYEEIRPSYPVQLIDDVISKTGITDDSFLLEIGAGTGKATVQLAEKGFHIHANEIGEDMAEILKDKCSHFPKVGVNVIAFEEWKAPSDLKYDMIYCAQAFHWIDREIKYRKCHELLKDNGYLVLFWYTPCDDKLTETKAIEEEVNRIVQKYITDYFADKGSPQRRIHSGSSNDDERKAEIISSGYFELIEKIEYTQEIKNNPVQYLKAMKSVPAFATLLDGLEAEVVEKMDQEITEVINQHGGYSGTLFEFTLYLAKKIQL